MTAITPTPTPPAAPEAEVLAPPVARKVPLVTFLHGRQRQDDYAWMDVKDPRGDAELMAHLTSENAHARAYMHDTAPLQDRLYREMRGRVQEADRSVPYRAQNWLYYTRTKEGGDYQVYCRRQDVPEAPEEIILDIDELAAGEDFFEIGEIKVSPDHKFLAYTFDTTGDTAYRLRVIDLTTGAIKICPTEAERVASVVWSYDCRTIYYTTQDATTRRDNQVWRHDIVQQNHQCIFEERDELFRVALRSGTSGRFIYLHIESHTTSEVAVIDEDNPSITFKPVTWRATDVQYFVDDDGRFFYFLTNEGGAQDYKVMRAPCGLWLENCGRPGADRWQEIVAHRPGVLLEAIRLFRHHLVVFERDAGLTRVRVQELRAEGDSAAHYIEFPESVCEVCANDDFGADMAAFDNVRPRRPHHKLRLNYDSMISPETVFEYDLDNNELTPLKVEAVPGYDQRLYHTRRIYATARDGTKVPMTIAYKGDLTRNGKRPCHVYSYGAYGYGLPAHFRQERLSLLDRGFIYVLAHVRGGNELGEMWHEDGKMMQKMNTFYDYIDCIRHLVKAGYTSPDRVTGQGGSAGGMLMGAVLNLMPTCVAAAILNVPFVDVIATMQNKDKPLTVGEFIEWGNPEIKTHFDYMIRYSPIDNIRATDYPAMLVRTGLADDKVGYHEPAKYVARMRALRTDKNPLIFTTLLDVGGHHGPSGRFAKMRDDAFEYAFLLKQVAHAVWPTV
jgi:oligopeptidase B